MKHAENPGEATYKITWLGRIWKESYSILFLFYFFFFFFFFFFFHTNRKDKHKPREYNQTQKTIDRKVQMYRKYIARKKSRRYRIQKLQH